MIDHEKWQAIINNDSAYDGKFYYAVKSTGIFCRPSCKSRLPKPENLEYFNHKEDDNKSKQSRYDLKLKGVKVIYSAHGDTYRLDVSVLSKAGSR